MSKEPKVKKPIYKRWWFWVLALIVVFNIAGGGDDEESAKEETDKDKATEVKAEPKEEKAEAKEEKEEPKKEVKKAPKKEKEYTIGDAVTVGKFEYTVKNVEETQTISNVLGDKTTEGKFAIIELSIKNLDKKARMADTSMFKVKTADDTEYNPDTELDLYVNDGGIGFFLEEINPNIAKSGKVVFELPAEATKYNIEVSSGAGWSGGKYKQIKIK